MKRGLRAEHPADDQQPEGELILLLSLEASLVEELTELHTAFLIPIKQSSCPLLQGP